MAKPVIAIVGRPNVGKSTFFNYISGKRVAIVEDTPGVTRDRIYADSEWRGRRFTMIDTGGIETKTDDKILLHMRKQAELAIELADVIVFLVDSHDGITANDQEVADLLRKSRKPIVLAVNKVDSVGRMSDDCYEFYNLGLGEIYPVSSIHGHGTGDLLDACFDFFPPQDEDDEKDSVIRVAVMGKPNAGKSSLVNRVLGEDRVIVSNVPGTTRDAIDTKVTINDQDFMLIDTAGIRRKSKVERGIEQYSVMRSFDAVDRADVCLLMIDAVDGVTEQDTKIAGYAHESGKCTIIAINKWDLIEKETGTLETFKKSVRQKLSFMQYAPIIFISAKSGQRVNTIFDYAISVFEQSSRRISTGILNDFLNEAVSRTQPPSDKGKRLKIFYMTQASVQPPTFVLFINDQELMHFSYERYIENQLRMMFGFDGTPIRFILRERKKDGK